MTAALAVPVCNYRNMYHDDVIVDVSLGGLVQSQRFNSPAALPTAGEGPRDSPHGGAHLDFLSLDLEGAGGQGQNE